MINNFCYIHIPFCTSKCKYCRFASFGNMDLLKINLYVEQLIKEINNSKADFKDLKSVYFGGGTPSTLSVTQLEIIINTLKKKYAFDNKIEINIEATPVTITKENIIGWKNIGINRISMGIQTLNNDSLIEIGRGEKGDIIKALNSIKSIGFDNVSVDFIIGLPYVKKGEIKKDIEYILNKFDYIKHISVYLLEEYYDISEESDSKFENITYPNNWNKLGIKDDDYLGEYIEIKNFLKIKGFNSYEISNFAKKGYECKHNSAYWNHSNMLAFGLGAHGFINGERYSNSEKFINYYSGKNITFEKLTKEDVFIEKVMFQLRTNGLTKSIYEKLDKDKLNEFIKGKYVEKKLNKVNYEGDENNLGYKIILSDKGVLILDYILKEIIK